MFIYKCKFSGMEWNSNCLQRSVQGILSILLSLKKSPVIRYQNFSPLARRLAENIRVSAEFIILMFKILNIVKTYCT